MIVSDIPRPRLRDALRRQGLSVRMGPFVNRIRSTLEDVVESLALHYADFPTAHESDFVDFHVAVERRKGIRRWLAPQVLFRFDAESPFAPLPASQAFPTLEWGLNWCVSSHCHRYIILHAAVLERDGFALLLPAPSGSGKSTLCAGLVFRGWRLLSDELALIDPAPGDVVALPRPISLKNESIEVIRRYAPEAVFGPIVHETAKGDVAHLRAPSDSVRRAHERAAPRWIVAPRYEGRRVTGRLTAWPKARAFMRLVDSAFNYHIHGRGGFDTLSRVLHHCDCFELTYSDLDDANRLLSDMQRSALGRNEP